MPWPSLQGKGGKVAVDHPAAIAIVTHDERIHDRLDHIFQVRDGRLEQALTLAFARLINRLLQCISGRGTPGHFNIPPVMVIWEKPYQNFHSVSRMLMTDSSGEITNDQKQNTLATGFL